MDDSLITGVYVAPLTSNPGIYRLIDNGQNWENIFNEAYIGPVICDPFGGIYGGLTATIGNSGWGVRYSPDNGLTWEPILSGLHDNASITSLAISPNGYIFATTDSPSKLYRSVNPVVKLDELFKINHPLRFNPNPCRDILNINLANYFVQNYSMAYIIEIINSSGSVVYCKSLEVNVSGIISCNVSYLIPGLYLVRVYSKLGMQQGRFIKF